MKAARFVALVALATAACYPVREVRRTATGGELALLANNDGSREEAGKLMTARCPNGYDILEEGEVVVGQVSRTDTQANTEQRRGFYNQPTQQTNATQTTTTEDKREWRILYQCKGVAGAPAADPAAPAPPAGNVLIPARTSEVYEVRYHSY